MSKHAALLFFLISLFFLFGLKPPGDESFKIYSANASPTETPIYCPPSNPEMDKTVVYLPCSSDSKKFSVECENDDSPIVCVRTSAIHPELKRLTYRYTVSGGKIIGQGAEVKWDLSGVTPGIYLITAQVEGANNFRCSFNKTITVKQRDCAKTDATSPVEVESVTFDKNLVKTYCPWNQFSCPKDAAKVKVTTLTKKAIGNNLNYYYTVSAGQIIGQGENVIWSFEGARPGTHTITVGVGSDNVIRGNVIAKTIELEDCPSCHPTPESCVCPLISVSGPSKTVKTGDTVVFVAELKGGDQKFVGYQWTVSGGTIAAGQGTSQIMIKVNSEVADNKLVTAKVKIDGYGLCDVCPREISKIVSVEDR